MEAGRKVKIFFRFRVLVLLAAVGGLLWLAACGSAPGSPATEIVPSAAVGNQIAIPAASTGKATEGSAASETPRVETTGEAAADATASATAPAAPTETQRATATLAVDAWKQLPVIPSVSRRARAIYQHGLELGNNPRAFSKVGDCESTVSWFLGDFDNGPRYYNLGDYTGLQATIEYFAGSYKRVSLAARPGFTATSVLTPLWADPQQCNKDESPLACEYRLHRPSFVLITLGSNNAPRPERFEPQLRRILDYSIERGVLPVLATKADNLEKDNSINAAIARLAYVYDLPLWNYWAAVQPLPHRGLQTDGAHLTWASNHFEDPTNMKFAWPVRNLTALQVLEAVRNGVGE